MMPAAVAFGWTAVFLAGVILGVIVALIHDWFHVGHVVAKNYGLTVANRYLQDEIRDGHAEQLKERRLHDKELGIFRADRDALRLQLDQAGRWLPKAES